MFTSWAFTWSLSVPASAAAPTNRRDTADVTFRLSHLVSCTSLRKSQRQATSKEGEIPMDTILVPGGTGRLGHLVVSRLHEAGCAVRVLSRHSHKAEEGIEFLTADLASGQSV